MFTSEQRAALRKDLLNAAAADPRISGTAITGSASENREDMWSDIDLAFGVRDAAELPAVLADFTDLMCRERGALDHVDVQAGAWIYRVFLLPDTMQVDLAFAPAQEFRALAPTFRLISGEAKEPSHFPAPSARTLIGMGWLHALHVRSAVARGRLWQAEYMVSGVRDHALALACLRNRLPAVHGRGFDRLPPELLGHMEECIVRQMDRIEIARAFRAAAGILLDEIRAADENLADRLQEALNEISRGAG